jgi:hypothetical protein
MGYSAGGTSILAGLNLAIDEISNYAKHSLTLVSEYPSYSTSTVERVSDEKGDTLLLNLAKIKVKKACHNLLTYSMEQSPS